MKTYLLSATGVIFLSVIVSLLVPEGKLNKSITFVMRLICIAVLIQPLTGIFKIGTTENSAIKTDYEYVASVYSNHQSEQLEKLLQEKLFIESECLITVEFVSGDFKVTQTEVKVIDADEKIIEDIYAYLRELGYINISVYAKST